MEPAETRSCEECGQDFTACDLTGCTGRYNPGFRERAELSDSDKLTVILENQVWLTNQLTAILTAAQRNPAFRFMMGKNR